MLLRAWQIHLFFNKSVNGCRNSEVKRIIPWLTTMFKFLSMTWCCRLVGWQKGHLSDKMRCHHLARFFSDKWRTRTEKNCFTKICLENCRKIVGDVRVSLLSVIHCALITVTSCGTCVNVAALMDAMHSWRARRTRLLRHHQESDGLWKDQEETRGTFDDDWVILLVAVALDHAEVIYCNKTSQAAWLNLKWHKWSDGS